MPSGVEVRLTMLDVAAREPGEIYRGARREPPWRRALGRLELRWPLRIRRRSRPLLLMPPSAEVEEHRP